MSMIAAGLILASCAGNPEPAATSAPAAAATEAAATEAAAPVQKTTRVITVTVPMEVESRTRFADGTLDEVTNSEYDPSGLLLIGQTRLSASGTLLEDVQYAYQGSLLVTKTSRDAEGKLLSVRTFTYDGVGRLSGESLKDGAGKPVSASLYAYDAAGKRVAWIIKDAKGVQVAETLYTVKDGRVMGAELRDGTGKKNGHSVYAYDAAGNIVSQKYYNALGSLQRIEASVWENGKPVREERQTAGGQVQYRTDYVYGPEGELQRKTTVDVPGNATKIVEYAYTFRDERRTVEE
jgi:hypothetical protein